jgi:hypothetical protein
MQNLVVSIENFIFFIFYFIIIVMLAKQFTVGNALKDSQLVIFEVLKLAAVKILNLVEQAIFC